MIDNSTKQKKSSFENARTYRVNLVPFTGGLLMMIYAFFWPEGYGTWLGTIVRAFRNASGI